MTNDNDNDNRIELISLNEFDEIDENERPFPDSDEAIRALQAVTEAVDEMEAEIARLRTENKRLHAERDEARKISCQLLQAEDSGHVTLQRLAEDRGWDCYEKKETP